MSGRIQLRVVEGAPVVEVDEPGLEAENDGFHGEPRLACPVVKICLH